MPDEQQLSLISIAEAILHHAQLIERSGSEIPTFQRDSFADLPESLEPSRKIIIENTEILNALARGTAGTHGRIRQANTYRVVDSVSLWAICHWNIPQHIPLEGSISFEDLARECGVPAQRLSRILRLAMTNHIFYEPRSGFIAHTADSRALRNSPGLSAVVGVGKDEYQPAFMKLIDSVETWPLSEEPNQTAWNLANDTDLPFYQYLKTQPERLRQFNSAITGISVEQGESSAHNLVDMYPWSMFIPTDPGVAGTIVDVGGGNGHVSIAIASKHEQLNFIVQDYAVFTEAIAPPGQENRIRFMRHDFFDEQPTKDADAYILSLILHNWSDKYAVRILRQLIPALKPGAKILVCGRLLPKWGEVTNYEMKEILGLDVMMMILMNAKQRSAKDYTDLFIMADPRFGSFRTYEKEGTWWKIFEATWNA